MEIGRINFQPLTYRTIGFDKVLNHFETLLDKTQIADKFPPHNIIRIKDNQYVVELAIAGFNKDEVEITLEKGVLTITGTSKDSDTNVEYLYKGIGTRSFTKSLRLADTVVVRGAEFKNGILRVGLENVIPEIQKPRKIEIDDELSFFKAQLLSE